MFSTLKFSLLARFLGDKSGNFMVIFAVSMVPIFGIAASAIDYSRFVQERTSLQDRLDAAVLAGVTETDVAAAQISAARLFLSAQARDESIIKDLKFWHDGSVLRASAVVVAPTSLMQIIGFNEITGAVASGATRSASGTDLRCIHALNATAQSALILNSKPRSSDIYAGASLIAANCIVLVNSTSLAGVQLKAGSFESGENCFVGQTTAPIPGIAPPPLASCDPKPDPFVNYVRPQNQACGQTVGTADAGGTLVLRPGVYCGGLSASADTIELEPGTYTVRGGRLEIEAAGTLTGDGVSFLLEPDAGGFSIIADAITLKAASNGPVAAFVVHDLSGTGSAVAGRKTKSQDNEIRFEQYGYLEGIVYTPKSHLLVRWRRPETLNSPYWTAPKSPFASFIADTIDFHGYSQHVFNYEPQNSDLPIPDELSLQRSNPRLTQ